jgi:lysophospholipase L1-like esterase
MFKNLFIALVSLAFSVSLVEGTLHAVDPLAAKKGRVAIEREKKGKNSLGLRGSREYPLEHSTYRILAIGDSFTYGLKLAESGSWPRQLESILQSKRPNIEILNGGRPGTDTSQQLKLFDKTLHQYRPNMVLIGFLLNDCTKLCANCGPVGLVNKLERFINHPLGLSRLSYLYRLHEVGSLQRELTDKTVDLYKRPYELELDTYHGCIDAFREFKTRADRENFSLAVVQYPMLFGLKNEYPFAREHAKVRTTLEAMNISVFDLAPAFKGHDEQALWVHPRDSHPNRTANAIAAKAIAERLEMLLPQT